MLAYDGRRILVLDNHPYEESINIMNPLERFHSFLVRCFNSCFNNPRTTLGVAAVFLFGVLSLFRPLEVQVTVDDLINKNDETSKEYFRLKKDFHLHTSAYLVFQNLKNVPFKESELCFVKKWVMTTGLEVPNIRETYSPLFLRESKLDTSDVGFQRLTFPVIVDTQCDGTTDILDPLKRFDLTPWMGLLVDKNHQDFAQEYQVGDLNQKDFVMEKIIPLMESLKQSAKTLPDSIKVHWLGDASYQAEMVKGILYNNALNIFVIFFIFISFRIFFGTWISGLLYVGTLGYSCAVIIGLMSLSGTPMDILNSSLFLFLAVSSLGDFVFLSQHEVDKGEGESEGGWVETFRQLITPCFFTSLTTFLGFISLCTSEVQIVARLGLWVAISGMIEWVVVLLILPAFMKVVLKKKTWVDSKRAFSIRSLRFLDKINFPRSLCFILISVFLLVPFCFSRLNVTDSPMELFKEGNPFKESMDYLIQTKGFTGNVSLVFNDGTNEPFNRRILEKMRLDTNVVTIENPYEYLAFYTDKLNPLQGQLVKKSLKETSQFKRYFSNDKVRAVIHLKDSELLKLNEFRTKVKLEYCPNGECFLSGLLMAYADFTQNVSKTLLSSFLLSFFLVTSTIVFLAYYTSNFRFIFPLLASSLWGVAMLLVALVLFQIKINFITSLVLAIMVGMNGDNTIQFILSGMDKGIYEGVKQRAEGSILTTLMLVSSSSIFLFHYFEPPVIFGLLLMFGFSMSLMGDLWILKGLLPKRGPEIKSPTQR